MKKIIMFIGAPGMNNMELAHYLQVTKYPKSIIIDRYDSWLRYPEERYSSDIVEYDLYKTITNALNDSDVVMIIAPFVLKVDRDNFFLYLKDEVQEKVELIGVWVERKYEDLKILRQLRLPYRQVPDETFEYLYKYRESPTPDEPFDDIVYITREINTGMSKNKPYITDILTTLDKI